VTLESFFSAMGAFVEGAGAAPSSDPDVLRYRTLVARQRRQVLDALFPVTAAAAAHARANLWDEITLAFEAMRPPTHWDPNRYGAPLAEWLGSQSALAIPPYVIELADFEWIRYAVSVAARRGLDHSIFVRHYRFDLPNTMARATPFATPVARPTTLIVGWSKSLVVVRASLAALVVLGRHAGRDPMQGRAIPGVDDAALADARRALARFGLLDH